MSPHDRPSGYAYTGGVPFDAARPCLVLLHGALHDHSVWTLAARWFAHHGRTVLAFDLPGHGRTPGPALASVSAIADWVCAQLSARGVMRAAVVGHSLGSLIALEVAARLGDQAEALVLVATAFPMKVAPALLQSALETPDAAIEQVNRWSHAGLAAKPSYPGPGHWLHGGNRALMLRQQARYAAAGHGNLFHHDFALCDAYADGMTTAPRLRCPVQALLGTRDLMTPERAAAGLLGALRAQVTRLPCGHALMQEDPDGVLRALQQALPVPGA